MGDSLNMPKISVIMPAYNAAKYIKEAIDSILAQTFSDFEFIILDDGSTDGTAEIVRSYSDKRIRFVQNEHNLGIANTLNRGLDLAKGEYIARMDADDISLPERFEKQVSYMINHPYTGICGSNILIFSKESTGDQIYLYSSNDRKIRSDMIFNSAFAHPSVMLRKRVLDEFQLRYDPDFERAEDYKLWLEILKYSNGINIQTPLLRYRHHGMQVTKTQKDIQSNAVNKVRQLILMNHQVTLNELEWNSYLKICNGERLLSEIEYYGFVSGGKKIIHSLSKGKQWLRYTFSDLNNAVIQNSCIKRCLYFSWKDRIMKYAIGIKELFSEH